MNKTVSVAMAVYNGEKYVREQLDSVLSQLRDCDELIISYNASSDKTWEIIAEYAKNDSRVKCYVCEQKGVISNFNNAIAKTTGNIIFLCDQDDIWHPEKVRHVLEQFCDSKVVLVEHNCEYIDASGEPKDGDLFKRRNAKVGFIKNLVLNCYQGSCMAFSRELIQYVYPVPQGVAMHDQWIGIVSERYGTVRFIDEKLIKYRRHDETVSDVNVSISKKLMSMICVIYQLFKRCGITRGISQ